MYQISRQLADEETGIPSIIHGQTGVTGTGRTAAGLSMLMGSAGLSMKTVIKNIDDYSSRLGSSFQWNMQFNDRVEDIEGDLEIKPRGVAAVQKKFVVSVYSPVANCCQSYVGSIYQDTKLDEELAITQDIDPDSLVNDQNEAQIYAQMLQGMMQNAQQAASAEAGGSPQQQEWPQMQEYLGELEGTDGAGSGNGTIGVGTAPSAGEAGFTETLLQLKDNYKKVIQNG